MKRTLLFGLAVLFCVASFAQKAQLKQGIPTAKAIVGQAIANDPVTPANTASVKPTPVKVQGDNPNIVTIIDLGTAANGLGYGYAGGQKTMVWADDNLGAIVNIHRMGPGTTPPSLSGYLAGDLGTNHGQTAADWQNQRQIYAATLNGGGTYYLDAARYPQGGIYNPDGNTALSNAYVVYFAPNLSNTISTWGGRSYGVDNCVNQADSIKHLYWYNAPPYTYIPDGFAIGRQGVTLATDIDQEWSGTTFVGYQGDIVVNRGIWNATTHDFDYSMFTVPFPTTNNARPANDRVAFSPDGNTAWIVVLGNNGVNIDSNYYPMVCRSTDGGATWEPVINVVLDGTNGIPGITQHLLSDYSITQLYNPPYPARDQIPYTTAFDCRISVDMWGNPHIGVIIGLCAGGFSIATADSAYAVYDIYSTDDGATWSGQLMGYPSTFRGNYTQSGSAITEDNRTSISSNMAGDKMFITWNDTQVPGVTTNDQCDVFARGFDLVTNKITKNGTDCIPNNVTFLSDVTQEANFQCTSYYSFSNFPTPGTWTIPIVTELLSVAGDLGQPVTFKYISDFSYSQADFACDVFGENPPFPVGINDGNKNAKVEVTIFPNPFSGITTLSVTLPQPSTVSIEVTNVVGQKVMTLDKGTVAAGKQTFTLNGSKLSSGVYFCSVKVDGKSYTQKMIVK